MVTPVTTLDIVIKQQWICILCGFGLIPIKQFLALWIFWTAWTPVN